MLKVLILYYLSLKPTHGYEIQKFIQVNHMDSWTKIQSGSIYYALEKLTKEGLIELSQEVSIGAKVRKIYSITPKGRISLKNLVLEELNSPICEVGSDKFILYPLLSVSGKDEIEAAVTMHIAELKQRKADTERWQSIKLTRSTLEVEKISFEMMLLSLEYQIKWHEALLAQLDGCIAESTEVAKLITSFDFSVADIADSHDVTDFESLKRKTLRL